MSISHAHSHKKEFNCFLSGFNIEFLRHYSKAYLYFFIEGGGKVYIYMKKKFVCIMIHFVDILRLVCNLKKNLLDS